MLERLEALMIERGYGPGELAYQSGLSYNYIWKIRKGLVPNIAAVQVQKLARALKTTGDYLQGESGVSALPAVFENGGGYVVGAALTSEVEALARRLDDLPAELRVRVAGLIEQSLNLLQEQVEEANVLPDDVLDLLWYFDRLPEEDRAVLQARADEMRAAERGLPGGQTDGPRGSAGQGERRAADR